MTSATSGSAFGVSAVPSRGRAEGTGARTCPRGASASRALSPPGLHVSSLPGPQGRPDAASDRGVKSGSPGAASASPLPSKGGM